MAYAKRSRNAKTAATKQSRKRAIKSNERAVLIVVARKQERSSSSSREGRVDGRAAEKEAEENFKGVSFMGALPLDLAMEVLRRLPLRSLVQLRTLSSSFNALLRAPPKTLRLCRQPPWLVTVRAAAAGPGPDLRTPRELAAYCPVSGTWFPFPPMSEGLLSAMGGPGLLQVLSIFTGDLCPLLSCLAMASAGGLMCAVVTALRPEAERQQTPLPCYIQDVDGYLSRHVFKLEDFYLLVFNVFTGASEQLPRPPPPPLLSGEPFLGNGVSVHMFLDTSAPGAYYVVLHSLDGLFFGSLCIYSSSTGCWRVGHAASASPSPCTFGDIQRCDMLYYDCQQCTPALLAYSVHSDAWLRMPISTAKLPGPWKKVFKWQGRVFLASSTWECATSFEVSVLTSASRWSDTASWVEVARTPSGLVQPFCMDVDVFDVGFVVCGDLVCMSVCMTVGMSANLGYHNTYLQPLVYDLAGGSWYLLPPPCIEGNKTAGFGVGLLAFQPDLQATP